MTSKQLLPNQNYNWQTRDYLPHFVGREATHSVTFRLYDSLPKKVWEQLKMQIDRNVDPKCRLKIDHYLDSGYGSSSLSDPRIGSIVEESLFFLHAKAITLHAWCLMPNHVHLLFTLLGESTLPVVIQNLKSYTAKKANQILGRTGSFWYREYFDRYIRDSEHFNRTLHYIENNPVKAGLCSKAEEWRYGSAWHRFHRSNP